jgi:hypothetical protein
MGEIDIVIFIDIKIVGVSRVGYECRPVAFTYMSRRVLGSAVTRTKNQLVYICNQGIRFNVL